MKRVALLFTLVFLVICAAGAQEDWRIDAERADGYFWAQDYDAAWLFYERALVRGCDDGVSVFRAAESFRKQQLIDDPEFSASLYAVAHHFLTEQYPDDGAVGLAEQYFDSETVVNRRYLRQVYGRIGGKAPRARFMVEGLGTARGFFAQRVGEVLELFRVALNEGIRSALNWARPRAWRLLVTWIGMNTLTGIILPVVMAVAVAREGRKSYVTAYAFLLHWGFLGIHRFYLGRWISGVIWLLTGGLLGLGVFFDLFLTGAYVRFWNEDNRSDRPLRSRSDRAPRQKPPKLKTPKRTKTKTVRPSRKAESRSTSTKKVDPSEEFSFNSSSPAGAAAAASSVAAAAEIDDDFGDLPDLDFDDLNDTESLVSDSSEELSVSDLPGELSDDEFEIEAIE